MNVEPVAVLLAAGLAQRFGSNKLLYPLHNETPMLTCVVNTVMAAVSECVVVINPELEKYRSKLEQLEQPGLRVVTNYNTSEGMGSSIIQGVTASRNAAGWLLVLADMPYIRAATIRDVVTRMIKGSRIVAPTYQGQRGHPVGFCRLFREELLSLHGDVGARDIIARHADKLDTFNSDDRGVIMDIDYPADITNRNS